MHLVDAGCDNIAKIPFAVVPIRAGMGEKVAKIGSRLIPDPHSSPGQPVMREMQRREQGRLVAGVQRLRKSFEHSERLGDRGLVRLGLSLVDSRFRTSSNDEKRAENRTSTPRLERGRASNFAGDSATSER